MEEQTMMLDEQALRRNDFDAADSIPIEMADGQTWYFAKPRLRFRFTIDPRNGIPVNQVREAKQGAISTRYSELLDRLSGAGTFASADDDLAFTSVIIGIAVELLRKNYDLPDDLVPELFSFAIPLEGNPSWGALLGLAWRSGPNRRSSKPRGQLAQKHKPRSAWQAGLWALADRRLVGRRPLA